MDPSRAELRMTPTPPTGRDRGLEVSMVSNGGAVIELRMHAPGRHLVAADIDSLQGMLTALHEQLEEGQT